ncbi:MAG: potassium-transporting ATPase subunit C [Candidatus Thermoplasmatota archaeon]|nr:potassium-transporting ATPase subunit C [Candidatus Thermoplasmatota archaeon]
MVNWKEMLKVLKRSLIISVITLVLLGLVIPTATAFITEKVDPGTGNGNQININGKVYGSYYLAQAFNKSYFFQPRPSAINFNQSQSGAQCCSPNTNASLLQLEKNLMEFEQMNKNVSPSRIPGAVIMDSDSGLDPNIPLSAAQLEEPRVASSIVQFAGSKNVTLHLKLVSSFLNATINSTSRQNFPVFGSYYVNVMYLDVQIIVLLMDNNVLNASSLD